MGTSAYSMADIANLTKAVNVQTAEKSTSRKGNTELNMQDFLQLMVVQLQNQTIDDTMDTSEMMNQMVQMQMVTAITNMNELSVMTYASSLVGKVVTIGILNGNDLEEREVLVIGTGLSNGQQVVFGQDADGNVETYALNQIMAVGHLPPVEGSEAPSEGEGTGAAANGVENSAEASGTTGTEQSASGTVDAPQTTVPQYNGENGADT